MNKDDFPEFEQTILYGITSDYYHALLHYKCYIKINSNIASIKSDHTHSEALFSYIQNSSLQLCIIHLNKIFDKSKDRPASKTRSLPKILTEISSQIKIPQLQKINDYKWKEFKQRFSHLLISLPSLNTTEFETFLSSFDNLLKKLEEKRGILARLRLLRNKRIAHNTSFSVIIRLSNKEIKLLLNITELFIEYINEFVITQYKFVLPIVSTAHLDSLLPQIKN